MNYDSILKAKKSKMEIAGFKSDHRELLAVLSASNLSADTNLLSWHEI